MPMAHLATTELNNTVTTTRSSKNPKFPPQRYKVKERC